MVDHDVWTRTPAPGWGRSARAVRDLWPIDDLQRVIEDDLYRHLRKTTGLSSPLLQDLIEQLRRFDTHAETSEHVLPQALGRLVWERCLGRFVHLMVGDGRPCGNVADALAYCERALAGLDLDVVADRLLRHPNGQGLRRPARARARTVDLLDEDAPVGMTW